MSKCENCIHFDMCAELHAYYHKVEKEMVIPFMCDENNEKLNCDHYKDKSLIVELPCKVGDEVWAVLSIGGIQWTDWYYIGQGKIKGYQIELTGDIVAIFSGTVCGKEISFHPVSIKGICKTKQEAEDLKQEWMLKEIEGK